MKHFRIAFACLSLATVATVPSCSTVQAQVQRIDPVKLGQLVDVALTVAVPAGKLSPVDAATIRTVGTIVLPPSPVPVPPPPGKQPLAHLQP